MSLFNIAFQELRYLLFSFQGLVSALALFGVAFLLTANAAEFERAASGGAILANSPYGITSLLIKLSIFSVLVAPAFVTTSALKDRDSQFDGIFFTLPISRLQYLGGRFIGAFLSLAVVFVAVPAGMLSGTFWPWVDPELIGPNNLNHYLSVLFTLTMPSLFLVSAVIFAIAVLTGKRIFTYIAVLTLLVIYTTASESGVLPAFLDPFMFQGFEQQTQYWTAAERNTQLLSNDANLIINRLLWTGIACVALLIAFNRFSFNTTTSNTDSATQTSGQVASSDSDNTFTALKPLPSITWTPQTNLHQFLSCCRYEFKSVFISWPFVLLMSLSVFMLVSRLTNREILYDVNSYPLTRLMISNMGAMLFAMLCILVFYSADVIWRERDSKVNDILDALPAPNWVFIGAKLGALGLILAMILALGILISISIQLLNNYFNFEAILYLERGFFYLIIPYLCLAVLACFLQVLAKNRYVGIILFGLFIGMMVMSVDLLSFQHPLFSYGIPQMPSPLSDMNGNGRFISAGYWQRAYWLSMAGLLLLITYRLWPRGIVQPLSLRMRGAFSEANKSTKIVAAVLLTSWVGTGGYIFYNTNVLNEYLSETAINDIKYAYETQYSEDANLPIPRIVDVDINVDLYPQQRRIEVSSTHVLENKTDSSIAKLHVSFPAFSEVTQARLDGAEVDSIDPRLQHYIFRFSEPLLPGQSRKLDYALVIQQQGFKHDKKDTAFVRNGTFLHNNRLAPYIGFNTEYLIEDKHVRKAYGLPETGIMPDLDDHSQHHNNALRQDSDFIHFKATVSTSADQIAVAPGSLVNRWTEGNRRFFTYQATAPIHNFYSFLSGRYEVVKDNWGDVEIDIFYHQTHDFNLTRMLDSVKDSLSYFSQAFSPYQYEYLRIIEFPAYRKMAQAFSGTIPYSEDIGFVADVKPSDIDIPYYVTAHEVAHQWWGHQVAGANTQGHDFIHESLAQYGALMVMEKHYGRAKVRQFLKYELDRYLSGRANASDGELPLYRVEKQQHIYYRKGALIMYALRDYLGEEAVNGVLQELIALRQYSAEPYATSTDFISLLKEMSPANFHPVITDWLERITLYDLSVTGCRTVAQENGRFSTTLTVAASKLYADSLGNEIESPLYLPIDLGLFSESPASQDFEEEDVILFKKQPLQSGENIIIFETEEKPAVVGVDPYNKLIDRNSDDNLAVSCQAGAREPGINQSVSM